MIVEVAGGSNHWSRVIFVNCCVGMFPHESVAVQVPVTEYEPAHEPW
jgi:hypothetical protein